MNIKKNKIINLGFEIFKFGIIGIINALIDLSSYWLLTRYFSFWKILAHIIAFLIANIFSFLANRKITFKNKEKISFEKYIKFLSITIISLIISSICLLLSIKYFKSPNSDIYGKIIGIILGAIWNFTMYKTQVFKKHNKILNTPS